MKVIQCLEDFGGPDDPVAFRCTQIFYENEGQYYRGLSKKRHASKDDVVLGDFYQTDLIPTNNFYPEYHQTFTRAHGNGNGMLNGRSCRTTIPTIRTKLRTKYSMKSKSANFSQSTLIPILLSTTDAMSTMASLLAYILRSIDRL